jgi:hypothetical protein
MDTIDAVVYVIFTSYISQRIATVHQLLTDDIIKFQENTSDRRIIQGYRRAGDDYCLIGTIEVFSLTNKYGDFRR